MIAHHILRWGSQNLSRSIFIALPTSLRAKRLCLASESAACRGLFASAVVCGPKKTRKKHIAPIKLQKKSKKETLELYEDATLKELVLSLKEDLNSLSDFILNLNELNLKYIDNVDVPLDRKLVLDVMAAYGFRPRFIGRPAAAKAAAVEDVGPQPWPPIDQLVRRAPVVTIMGHVDHGKTTLLDTLRNSQIASQEFGGITQHIGAFSVVLPKTGDSVTFIDTPGHAAFKAMRERGARSTDIVVLVVAADDGVKDQTVESIRYAAEAGVPIVVAINKCDKPRVVPEQVKHQLLEHDVVVEEMGGNVQVVEISALQGHNLDKLQEALVAQADIMDLRSTPAGRVEGVVIESTTIQGLGRVCAMIVNRGTLRKNAAILAGTSWGCVRTLHNEFNKPIEEAGPSCPVRISGWHDELPQPGEIVYELENESVARQVAGLRARQKRDVELVDTYRKIEEQRAEERRKYVEVREEKLRRGLRYCSAIRSVIDRATQYVKQPDRDPEAPPELKLILRCDVDGTLEAILNVLETYSSELADLDIVDFGVGPPNENVIELAHQFKTLVYCFNVPISPKIQAMAVERSVELRTFRVIYHLVDQLKDDLSAVLPPIVEEKLHGEGHVLRQFLISAGIQKSQPIAGTFVDWGVFDRSKSFRFLRKDRVIYDGPVDSLKCETKFVQSTGTNTEVGIAVPNKDVRFKSDDRVEVYERIVTPQRIDWNPPGF